MRRLMLVVSAALALLVVGAGTAAAAKPVEGTWTGTKSLDFVVNAAGTKITDFAPGGCAAGPMPWEMKVAANGAFSLKKKIGLQGGRPVTMKIKGKFTTPTTASGSISYGKCKQKFKATGKAPVVEPPPEEEALDLP
jgi:hypothetical protein